MGYELETSEFLFPSLFCNASKNTLFSPLKSLCLEGNIILTI